VQIDRHRYARAVIGGGIGTAQVAKLAAEAAAASQPSA
jgi:hypothetical protein